MARVAIRSEFGASEIELRPGMRVSVATSGRAEVLVDAASDALVAVDRQTLRPFRRGGRAIVTASLAPVLVVGARRLEVRELGSVSVLDLIGEEARAIGREFRAMVETVETDLPRLKGPFWYLSPARRFIRAASPVRIATFLLDHVAEIEAAVRRIDVDPARRLQDVPRVVPAGARVDVGATRALIHRRPDLLQPHEPGAVRIKSNGMAPSMVVIRRTRRDLSTAENRRLAAFLRRLWHDAREVQAALNDPDVVEGLKWVQTAITNLLHHSFLREVQGGEGDEAVLEPTAVEVQDADYARVFALCVHYLGDVNPGTDESALERQHMARADEIFQAYTCYVVAEAMDLEPFGEGLRDRDTSGVSFRSGEWGLFYDVSGVVGSWRASTLQPDRLQTRHPSASRLSRLA